MAMESSIAKEEERSTTSDGGERESHDQDRERIAYNARITEMREQEYPMLKDQIYLDHAGTTIPSASLMAEFAKDISSNLYGNPHSLGSASSQRTSARIDNIRLKVLQLFNASPEDYEVVFVANATAGIKLVAETFANQENGFEYFYHRDSHTSVVGVRELAKSSTCIDSDEAVEQWITSRDSFPNRAGLEACPKLFAFPAQSNMDGRHLPLGWVSDLKKSTVYSLLDAAALVSTSPLDLSPSGIQPDFVVMSFYKMFGFPDLGTLLIHKSMSPLFAAKRFFGGGTVETVSCDPGEQWHYRKNALAASLEDGTLPFHNIVALDLAIANHERLFNGLPAVSRHTRWLARQLFDALSTIRHENGSPVCEVYNRLPLDYRDGPVLAMNFTDSNGAFISNHEVQKLASIRNIHLRTGNLCNPGGVSRALGMNAAHLRDNYSAGVRCGAGQDIMDGQPTGVVRVSIGAMSTVSDIEAFASFVREFFVETLRVDKDDDMNIDQAKQEFYIQSLVVYPIKSCAGYIIPGTMPWAASSNGLAFDREFCIMHQGTGAVLNQKRYPRLVLFKPSLDLESLNLVVEWSGSNPERFPCSIVIPLQLGTYWEKKHSAMDCSSDSCSGKDEMLICTSSEINNFFSAHLDAPVLLARQNSDLVRPSPDMPGSFPTPPPSPPRRPSLSNLKFDQSLLTLANESPILVVFQDSLDEINSLLPDDIAPIPVETFRANIVLRHKNFTHSSTGARPTHTNTPVKLIEDSLFTLQFQSLSRQGSLSSIAELKLLAPCRRCQMIAINQSTAQRRPEVFAHLAKLRKGRGGIWFGIHATVTTYNGAPQLKIQVGDELITS